ncbi:MAG: 2-oxoacid:acceptor oxidoreductase family protein [Candidatus Jordarchaeum sp.]|uniref:2-oxoacid:acceptor oxidoreductase family protein n=1 Tax=Candidatus Jordarchaeum sp. TaxID=2823881 RepID=UPI004049913B
MEKDYNMILTGIGGMGVVLASDILAMAALEESPENKVRTSQLKGMSQRSASVIVHLRFGPNVDSPLVAKGSVDALLSLELSEGLRYMDYLNKNSIAIINTEINIPPIALHGKKVEINQSLCYGCGNCIAYCQVNYYFKGNHDFLVLSSPATSVISGKCIIQDSCTGCGQCFSVCPRSAKKLIENTAYPEMNQIANLLKEVTKNVFMVSASDLVKDLGNPRVANILLLGILLGTEKVPLSIKTVESCISRLVPANFLDINLKAFRKGVEKGREILFT